MSESVWTETIYENEQIFPKHRIEERLEKIYWVQTSQSRRKIFINEFYIKKYTTRQRVFKQQNVHKDQESQSANGHIMAKLNALDY